VVRFVHQGNTLTTIGRGLLAATATIALTGLLAPAAYAERVVHRDVVGDASTMTFAGPSEEEPSEEVDPTEVQVDVLRTAVDHRAANVVLTVNVADLRRQSGSESLGLYVRLVTNEGVGRRVTLEVDGGHPQGRLSLTTRNDASVQCADKTRRVDYANDLIRVVVPRSCLSGPRWVRAGFGVYRFAEAADSAQIWLDDANRNGTVTDDVLLGARVRRS